MAYDFTIPAADPLAKPPLDYDQQSFRLDNLDVIVRPDDDKLYVIVREADDAVG